MKKPTRKNESTSRPKAKFSQASGYGTNSKRRTKPGDEAAPRAKRPAFTSGYGTNSKRRKEEDEVAPRRKPKAVVDGGERPASRRRFDETGQRPRRDKGADGDKPTPRRGIAARFRREEQSESATARPPRRVRTNAPDQDARPKVRSRFIREDKDNRSNEAPREARGNRFFDKTASKTKSREENRRGRPSNRTDKRVGSSEEIRPRRGPGFQPREEKSRRFAAKGRDLVKKNFKRPASTPDYDFSELENKRRATRQEKEGTIRLNRYIANAGVCSRRDADVLIQSGEIKVNGKVVTEMGYQIKPNDVVKYGNRVLNREKMVYVLLNKPKDFITTTEDPEERRTVMDLVSSASEGRLFPVGRLDRNTTGLLLLTNDGELSEKLTHPSNNISKLYEVQLDKPITKEDFDQILKGVELEDGVAPVDELATVSPDRTVLGIQLHLGRNRIVRRIFEHLGYEVVKLDRVMYAGLTKKDLPRGKWRYLSEKELIRLKYFL